MIVEDDAAGDAGRRAGRRALAVSFFVPPLGVPAGLWVMARSGRGNPGWGEGAAAAINGLVSTAIIAKVVSLAWTYRAQIEEVVRFAWGL